MPGYTREVPHIQPQISLLVINNGLIIQWGKNHNNTNTITIIFPIAFLTNYSVVAMFKKNKVDDTGGLGNAEGLNELSSNLVQMQISHYNSDSNGLCWIAIGC